MQRQISQPARKQPPFESVGGAQELDNSPVLREPRNEWHFSFPVQGSY